MPGFPLVVSQEQPRPRGDPPQTANSASVISDSRCLCWAVTMSNGAVRRCPQGREQQAWGSVGDSILGRGKSQRKSSEKECAW